MSSPEVALSYLKYLESLFQEYTDTKNANLFQDSEYVLTPLDLVQDIHPKPSDEATCVNYIHINDPITFSDLESLFTNDIYEGVERVFSHLVNYLLLFRLGYPVKPKIRLYKLLLGYFGPINQSFFKVRNDFKYDLRFNLKKGVLKVLRCKYHKSRRYSFSCMLRLLSSCLFIKRCVWGLGIYLNDILKIINYVSFYKNLEIDWETTEILSSNSYYGFLTLTHFVSNVLFKNHSELDILVSTCSRWRSFELDYFREVILMILFINCLNVNNSRRTLLDEFKKAFNLSFNLNWNFHSSMNTNELNCYLRLIRQFYFVMNTESPLKDVSTVHYYTHPRPFIPLNLVLDHRYNLHFLDYVIFVIKLMLDDASRSNILVVIQLVVHYFTYCTLQFGYLKCSNPYKCLKCTSTFSRIYCGLMGILLNLRNLDYHYSHLFLVRMLIKNELERFKACFFGSYTEVELANFIQEYNFDKSVIGDILDLNLTKCHYSPKFSKFLKFNMCHSLLKRCLEIDTGIFIKENSVSNFSKCTWFLRLLLCVDSNVNKVDARVGINKTLSSTKYLHLDQLSHHQPRVNNFSTLRMGNNVLTDELDILYTLYVGKPSIHHHLSTFSLNDQLNIIQRTQSCLALSKDLNYVELVLDQLVQSLVIDPGDRIINLLYLSTENPNVRNRIIYLLSCLIYSNINISTNYKIYTFIKYIFNLLSDDIKFIYYNQIKLHGQLLNLTLKLNNLPMSKRFNELYNKILNIHNMIKRSFENGNNSDPSKDLYIYKSVDTPFKFANKSYDDKMSLKGKNDEKLKSKELGDSELSKETKAQEGEVIVDINMNSIKILNSATRVPFMISYVLRDGSEISYIYKMRDDLRQDCLAIQVKKFMLNIFQINKLDLYLKPFMVIPYSSILLHIFGSTSSIDNILNTSPFSTFDSSSNLNTHNVTNFSNLTNNNTRNNAINNTFLSGMGTGITHEIGGIVGFIPDTISRHNIGKEFGVSIKHFFLKKFGHEYSPNYIKAVNNFIISLAGYSLLSFILQVKDRHNGNLLFTTNGHIIHIDFGFILGASPAKDLQFELAPFKFTKEMVEFMGGTNSENFRKFVHLLLNAYLALRTHSNLVVTLVQLLQYSKIPCFRKSTLIKLKRRLRLNDSPLDAKNYIMRKIFYALHSKTTKLYDVVQGYQQGIQH